mgnify:CR=1 FL=1
MPFFHNWPPIYIIILSIIIIGFIQVFTTYVITHEVVYPYQGWLTILEHKETIIQHLNSGKVWHEWAFPLDEENGIHDM